MPVNIDEVVKHVDYQLSGRGLFLVNPNREWPDSLYYSRGMVSKHLCIRVSNHTKQYWAGEIEINILIREGMELEEINTAVKTAVKKFEEEEKRIEEDLYS